MKKLFLVVVAIFLTQSGCVNDYKKFYVNKMPDDVSTVKENADFCEGEPVVRTDTTLFENEKK